MRLFCAITLWIFVCGCVSAPRYVGFSAMLEYEGKKFRKGQIGTASFYSKEFHGRKTASGEIFNMHKVSAAHRDYPLGSLVRVTNLKNGRSILLRINDRGPFVEGRILDLSEAAAGKLGYLKTGLTSVKVELVALPK